MNGVTWKRIALYASKRANPSTGRSTLKPKQVFIKFRTVLLIMGPVCRHHEFDIFNGGSGFSDCYYVFGQYHPRKQGGAGPADVAGSRR